MFQHRRLEYKIVKISVRQRLHFLPFAKFFFVIELEVRDDNWYWKSNGEHSREGTQSTDKFTWETNKNATDQRTV